MDSPIIVALDKLDKTAALDLARKLKGLVWGFKVNDLFFEQGVQILKELQEFGKVMCDGKFHDIPNTLKNTLEKLRDHADIFTIHASGGGDMIDAASLAAAGKRIDAAAEAAVGKIAAVTVLTSLDEEACWKTYGGSPKTVVVRLGVLASLNGATYMVSSGQELADVAGIKLKKIVPGIRPAWYSKGDDQKRVVTPAEAIKKGADLLVIGRPIVQASDPADAAKRTLEETRAEEVSN